MDKEDSFLFRTIWNEGLDMIKGQRKYESLVFYADDFTGRDKHEEPFFSIDLFEDNSSDGDSPENKLLFSEENELILNAINSLPKRSRTVCKLLYAGKKNGEIGKELKIDHSTVVGHKRLIRRKFTELELGLGLSL
ncbi:MAG TPA: hypothetical protein DIW23_04695 [Anaerolineae bacterium]|nr:hypothetical protein [Anaerolineae bacterium]